MNWAVLSHKVAVIVVARAGCGAKSPIQPASAAVERSESSLVLRMMDPPSAVAMCERSLNQATVVPYG